MAVTPDKPAPYAPPTPIVALIERHRSRGLPSPINAETLQRSGLVTDSLIPRTLQALQVLELITETGEPTQTLEGIRLAPETEYKQRLADWLNGVYADVLQYVDPATASEVQVRDAFRAYNPTGQQARMVTLFTGLYAAAGVGAPRESNSQPRAVRAPSPRPAAKPSLRSVLYKTPERKPPSVAGGLPQTIAALLADLPPQGGGWTQDKRDRFVTMFESMLDYNYKIVAEAREEPDDEEAMVRRKVG